LLLLIQAANLLVVAHLAVKLVDLGLALTAPRELLDLRYGKRAANKEDASGEERAGGKVGREVAHGISFTIDGNLVSA
jgi:hypothetical protein